MLKISHLYWILIVHSCDESTIFAATTSPVQTFVGWNASFNIQLNPYPSNDSSIQIAKNGTILILVKGTHAQEVSERFEFTGNTFENRISFILRNVTLGDAGTYTATETGYIPGEQKLIVKVAPSKPEIFAITGSAVLGSDYRPNCSSVSNSAPPDHGLTMMSEWKVNDQLITAGGRYKVQGTELTIASLTRQDNNSKLTCVVYEDSLLKSVPSSEHVIDVMYGPGNSVNLGSNPSTLIVYLHQRAPDITCSATCNPPCNYRWYHNSTLYSSGATLSLGVVANKTSGGNYTCEAFNGLLGSEGPSSTSVSLHVYYGAEIVSLSVQDSNTVNENSSAIFQCQIDSNSLPTVIWKKEGTNTVLKTESGVLQSQYRIESAQCQDTDNYTCSAYNEIGTPANRTLHFFVKCHPRTDSEVPPETKVYSKRYGDAFLRYTVISYPLPKFTWMFLGNGSESKGLPSSAKPYVNGRQSELRFTSLNIDDFGYYSVIANNSLPPSAREVFEIISAESRTDTLGNLPIPAIAGGIVAGAVVILLVLLSIFLWRRCQYSSQHSDENLSEKHEKRGSQDIGLVPNPVYDASESPTGFSINQGAIGAEYAAVVKLKKKVDEKEDQSKAQVDKTLGKEKKGVSRGKSGKAPKGDIYENAVLAGQNSYPETKYENPKSITIGTSGESLYEDAGLTSSNIPVVKKDGLLYADIVLNPPAATNGKPIIRGIENCTEYADIAFGKRGEPLPDISDEKEKF